jgi:hypothetical protein
MALHGTKISVRTGIGSGAEPAGANCYGKSCLKREWAVKYGLIRTAGRRPGRQRLFRVSRER